MNEEQITKIQKYFEYKPVLKAYLFGSQVRNDTTSDSDIDILNAYVWQVSLLFYTTFISI